MNINKLIAEQYSKLNLRRVKLKSDPANLASCYEGYVLEECAGEVKIIIITNPPPASAVNGIVTTTPDKIEDVEAGIASDNPVLQQVNNTDNDEFKTEYLKNDTSIPNLKKLLQK